MTKKELKLWKEYTKWVEKENKPWMEKAIEMQKEDIRETSEEWKEHFAPWDEWLKLPIWKQFFTPQPMLIPPLHIEHKARLRKIIANSYMIMLEKPTQEGFMNWLVKKEKI